MTVNPLIVTDKRRLVWRHVLRASTVRLESTMNRILVAFFLTAYFQSFCSGAGWEVVNPQPTVTSLYAVISADSQIVATGSLGSVLTSKDGEHWTKTRITDSAGECIDLSQLAWSGRLMIATANVPGVIWSSPDGMQWTRVTLGFSGLLSRLIWTGSKFAGLGTLVSGGRASQIFVSSEDGLKWTSSPVSVNGGSFRDIAWTGERYIATGSLTTPLNQAKSFINFLAWKNITGAVTDVPFAAYSSDGKNWHVQKLPYSTTSPPRPRSIVWAGQKAVILTQEAGVYTSETGTSWNGEIKPSGLNALNAINLTWTENELIAVGSLNGPRGKTPPGFFTSNDGENWTQHSPVISRLAQFTSATKAGGQYVAVGSDGLIQTSPTGDDWDLRSPLGFVEQISKAATSGFIFVAVGGDAVLTSADGIAWTVSHPANFDATSVIWAGSQFIAVGETTAVFTSSNGKDWTAHQRKSGGTLFDIAWNGKIAVAVGLGGEKPAKIMTSADGIDWTDVLPPSETRYLSAVTWSGSQFVAVGDNASIITSPDGVVWTKVHGANSDPYLRGIAWSGRNFVAVGVSSSGQPNAFISSDGASWSGVTIPWVSNFNAVSWCGDRFVAAGERGVVFESKDGTSWAREPLVAESNFTGILDTSNATFIVGSEGTILRKDRK